MSKVFSFVLSKDEADNTPSRRDGICVEAETTIRSFACQRIQEAGYLLRLSEVVVARAQILLHRFLSRVSIKSVNVDGLAKACLFLASKTEEQFRVCTDVVNVFYVLSNRGSCLDANSHSLFDEKESVYRMEEEVLRQLGFALQVDHPHRYITFYAHVLLRADSSKDDEAWKYVNDSMRADLCVRFPASTIAASALYLATRNIGVKLPREKEWWTLFDCSWKDIEYCGSRILSLYDIPIISYDVDYSTGKLRHEVHRHRSRTPVSDRNGSQGRERKRRRSRSRSRRHDDEGRRKRSRDNERDRRSHSRGRRSHRHRRR